MTPRQRALSAFNHEAEETVPAYVRIIQDWEKHLDYLGVKDQEALFDHLGNTIRSFVPDSLDYQDPGAADNIDKQVTIDVTIWGIPEEFAGTYSDGVERPLSRAEHPSDVEKAEWPSGSAWDFGEMKERLKAESSLARLSPSWMPVFSRLAELMGMEKAMTDMYMNRPLVEATLERIDQFYTEFYGKMLAECGPYLEFFGLGDDFAANTGLMFEPRLWRELFKPLFAKYIGMGKSHGLLTFMHSCGNITEVLPDLIDMGLDGWQTVQTHLNGMEPATLKREYGKHITFVGAIDSTNVLWKSTPREIREHVRKQISILGKGGGYICAPDHIILSDVPSENLAAMYDACREFRFN